jgi:hypothetical protein
MEAFENVDEEKRIELEYSEVTDSTTCRNKNFKKGIQALRWRRYGCKREIIFNFFKISFLLNQTANVK